MLLINIIYSLCVYKYLSFKIKQKKHLILSQNGLNYGNWWYKNFGCHLCIAVYINISLINNNQSIYYINNTKKLK
jgi:hypothetical protein